MRDRGAAELRAGQSCGRRLRPQGRREHRAVWARRGESGALQDGCVCAGPERCVMARVRGRLAAGSGGAAAAALRREWRQCMRGRGSGDRAPLEEAAAAGPRRCGERRVLGGERPRGSVGGGAFVPRGPNKGVAGPGRAGRGGCRRCPWCWRRRPAARLRPERRASSGGGRKAGIRTGQGAAVRRAVKRVGPVCLPRSGLRVRNPEHPSRQVRLRPGGEIAGMEAGPSGAPSRCQSRSCPGHRQAAHGTPAAPF